MKTLLIFIVLVLCFMSCTTYYQHEYTCWVKVTYFNGDVDTISRTTIFPHSESKTPSIYVTLNNDACVVVKNGFWGVDKLACGVRTYTVLSEKIKTSITK